MLPRISRKRNILIANDYHDILREKLAKIPNRTYLWITFTLEYIDSTPFRGAPGGIQLGNQEVIPWYIVVTHWRASLILRLRTLEKSSHGNALLDIHTGSALFPFRENRAFAPSLAPTYLKSRKSQGSLSNPMDASD